MKKQRSIQNLCMMAGVIMLIVALLALMYWGWNIRHCEQQASMYVETLRTLIPEPQDALPEERRDNTMSTLSIDGVNFVGLLELPRYGSVLPVCNDWGRPDRYPCRFDGSIYDGSMQIGATTQTGQYSFYRDISVGDTVVFTDVEGNRYTFQVSAMRYEKQIDQKTLQREAAACTLFVKNMYAFEYLVIFCQNAT